MKYNLVRNGSLKALTASGTGNVDLSITQLERLVDGNTTSDGVIIPASGVLFLELDLSNRIKLDGIRLYANDLSKSDDIKFYYKNYEENSYAPLSTISGAYYSTTIPSPSAPRFILTTISGVNITLYEFEVFNDDYNVSYGIDGSLYATSLPSTPLGYESDAQPIAIYNNGTDMMPADAYTCIDYTGSAGDGYLKISASENGPYIKLEDGAIIEDDEQSSKYFWSMGALDGFLKIYGDAIIPTDPSITIPMLDVTNSFNTAEHCWDYDSVNGKLYAIGSSGYIHLWEFDYEALTFHFIGEVDSGASGHARRATMCYMGGKIYCLSDGTTRFGFYDLSGAPNNWTLLASHPVGAPANVYRRNICSDYSRYIYCIQWARDGTAVKNFYSYDTVSGTWNVLSPDYDNRLHTTSSMSYNHMWYDVDRGFIYLVNGFVDSQDSKFIQRYNVAENTWNTTFIDTSHLYSSAWDNARVMAYYNNKIYFTTHTAGNKLFIYDLLSPGWITVNVSFNYRIVAGSLTTYNYGIAFENHGKVYFLASNLTSDVCILKGLDDWMDGMSLASGDYTSPIFQLDERTQSSYFLVDGTAVSGVGNISYDPDVYNGTIRIRSSDEEPVIINEVYAASRTSSTVTTVTRWDLYNDAKTDKTTYGIPIHSSYGLGAVYNIVLDRRTGMLALSIHRQTAGLQHGSALRLVDSRLIKSAYSLSHDSNSSLYNFGRTSMQFDNTGGLWGYNTLNTLYHFSHTLTVLATIGDDIDFIYDLTVELNGTGVWYTDKVNNLVIHRNTSGALLQTIMLTQPRAICGTLDNGCWVADALDKLIRRYSSSGSLLVEYTYPDGVSSVGRMVDDMRGGFWFSADTHWVYHMTSDGVLDVPGVFVPNTVRIYSTIDGCVAYNSASTDKKACFVDYASQSVVREWANVSNVSHWHVGVFSLNIDRALEYNFPMDGEQDPTYIPASYDPLWGKTDGKLEWKEVKKDGYYLPKHKHHQVEVTLRGNATLEKIIMAPAIRTQDIQSKSYKNIYLKTDVPSDAPIDAYEARLKTWWGVND